LFQIDDALAILIVIKFSFESCTFNIHKNTAHFLMSFALKQVLSLQWL